MKTFFCEKKNQKTFVLLGFILWPGLAHAQELSWRQRPGAQVPLDAAVHEETAARTGLSTFFGKTPVILDLGYYRCPALCGVVRADLLHALSTSALVPGKDYTLVALSIDPNETPKDAADAKAADLEQAGLTDGSAWHYLTGPSERVAQAVGFEDRWKPEYRQFLHPTGLVVLTPAGIVSSYLLGVGYSGGDLRAAVLEAGNGGIAKASLPILLLCFHYDPSTGRYTVAIEKILRLLAGLTVVTLAGLLLVLHRRRPT